MWHITEVLITHLLDIRTGHFTFKSSLNVNIRICANKAYQNYAATYMHM